MALILISPKKKKSQSSKIFTTNVSANIIEISTQAAQRILFLCQHENKPDYLLQIGLKKSGCAGNKLAFKLVKNRPKNWLIFSDNNARICIALNSLELLGGSTLSLTSDKAFILLNPKITGSCPCGKSFRV